MKFGTTDIGNFANATSSDGGPAEEVLKAYGQKNGKIHKVFEYLHRMNYYVGMHIIKKYGKCFHETKKGRRRFQGCFRRKISARLVLIILVPYAVDPKFLVLLEDENNSETTSQLLNRFMPSAPPYVSETN